MVPPRPADFVSAQPTGRSVMTFENVSHDVLGCPGDDRFVAESVQRMQDLVLEIETARVEYFVARSEATHARPAAALEALTRATAFFGERS